MADLEALAEALIKGDRNTVVELTQQAIDEGVSPKDILESGLIAGMSVIGKRFKANEVYVPEVLIAARAMHGGMDVLQPKLIEAGVEPIGTVVLGTVKGDLHDIGKNLVGMMLTGSGLKVVDIGTDVSAEKFVEACKDGDAHLCALSALLTTTMPQMTDVRESACALCKCSCNRQGWYKVWSIAHVFLYTNKLATLNANAVFCCRNMTAHFF